MAQEVHARQHPPRRQLQHARCRGSTRPALTQRASPGRAEKFEIAAASELLTLLPTGPVVLPHDAEVVVLPANKDRAYAVFSDFFIKGGPGFCTLADFQLVYSAQSDLHYVICATCTTGTRKSARARVGASALARARGCVGACVGAWVRAWVRACVRARVRACVRARVPARANCALTCVRACVRACARAYASSVITCQRDCVCRV